jgi:SRSO17 transposase
MAFRDMEGSGDRFLAYVGALSGVIGHADRVVPLRDYCTGLILPGDRKSVEPMAARTAPERTAAQHQSLLHFVGVAEWSDEKVLGKVRDLVLPSLTRQEPIAAWIIDDTSFPKQGRHSVGVQHQYCGQLGKQANCQVAVTLSLANHRGSLPVAYRLYLPQAWSTDEDRRKKAGVPSAIEFQTKPQIALDQIRWACQAGLARGVALMDGAYGSDARLRTGMAELGVRYAVAIQSNCLVWPPGTAPRRHGRPLNNTGRRDEPDLVSVKTLALGLPLQAWQTVQWREGTADWLSSRFAHVRVRAAHHSLPPERIYEETLLIEWPEGAAEPTRYWFSTLPAETNLRELVDLAKLRWRIERDYQELKQEVGLGHFEGRGWRGFHHHATLAIAAYGFLIAERETIPPSAPGSATRLQTPDIPSGYRPTSASIAAGTPHSKLDRDIAHQIDKCTRPEPKAMSLLRRSRNSIFLS